jgi:hypothetical protein
MIGLMGLNGEWKSGQLFLGKRNEKRTDTVLPLPPRLEYLGNTTHSMCGQMFTLVPYMQCRP